MRSFVSMPQIAELIKFGSAIFALPVRLFVLLAKLSPGENEFVKNLLLLDRFTIAASPTLTLEPEPTLMILMPPTTNAAGNCPTLPPESLAIV